MNIGKTFIYDIVFFILAFALVVASVYISIPFVGEGIAAFLYCLLTYPLYKKLLGKYRTRSYLTSVIVFFISVILVFTPLIFLSTMIIRKTIETANIALNSYQSSTFDAFLNDLGYFLNNISFGQANFNPDELKLQIYEKITGIIGTIASSIQVVANFTFNTILSFFIFVIFAIVMLPNWSRIKRNAKHLIPLKPEIRDLYLRRGKIIILDVIKGTLIIAILQGIVAGVFLFLIGVPNALLISFLVVVASVIPLIGNAIITIPIGIYYIVMGQYVIGIAIILWQLFAVGLVDNLVRPFLVSNEVRMHPVIMFIAFLGGVSVFGPVGIILGPLIVVLMITTIEIFQSEYLKKDHSLGIINEDSVDGKTKSRKKKNELLFYYEKFKEFLDKQK